jgi:hypothetical protein
MKTTQAWAWLTAGVLALGLNGIYHDGEAQWVHRAVAEAEYQAAAVLSPLSGRVEPFLANLQLRAARSATQNCRVTNALARVQSSAARAQSGIARLEAMSARQEARCARLEANRARIESQAARAQFATMDLEPFVVDVPEIHVKCPRVHVIAPRLPVIRRFRAEVSANGPV